MQYLILIIVALYAYFVHVQAQDVSMRPEILAQVSSGQLERFPAFPSKYVNSRPVLVWTPPGYEAAVQQGKKYSVLYMHDGENLFDKSVTWNKQEWTIDETASRLMQEGSVKDFIVVGIFTGRGEENYRHKEYYPEKVYRALPKEEQERLYGYESQTLYADEYLQFLTKELKPFIDSKYNVHTDAAHTAVMGSSMGGLISMYAISEYPEIFGAAACVSTHWVGWKPQTDTGIHAAAFMEYMKETLPPAQTHRIYFDYGDQTLDQYYPKYQKQVDLLLQDLGYDEKNWKTVFAPGTAHDETSWAARVDQPLGFLFGKDTKAKEESPQEK